jgi:hypothetical protein
MTTDSNNQQTGAGTAVDMSPEAIRARLLKVDELRRLAKYLGGLQRQSDESVVDADGPPASTGTSDSES